MCRRSPDADVLARKGPIGWRRIFELNIPFSIVDTFCGAVYCWPCDGEYPICI